MDFAFFDPWHRFLPGDVGHVVAFSGGRGKGGVVSSVVAVLAAMDLPVVRAGPGAQDPGDEVLVLADADGPGDYPLRLPPPGFAWPQRTSLAVVVLGVGSVGGFVRDAVAPDLASRAGLAPDAVLTWDDVAEVLLDPGVTGLPQATPTVLALTGLHEQPDSVGLFGFAGRVMTDPRLPIVLFCSGGGDMPDIRACCRAAAGQDPGTRGSPAR